MSTGLYRKMGATISFKNAGKVMLPGFKNKEALSEKIEDLWDMKGDDLFEKLKELIIAETETFPQWQKDDIFNHLNGGKFCIHDFISYLWEMDEIEDDFIMMSPLDNLHTRSRQDVDWYAGEELRNEFFTVKSGFVGGVEGMQFEGKSNNKKGLVKGNFYSIAEMAKLYTDLSDNSTKKMKKSELIEKMHEIGFVPYITPFYYFMIKSLGYLKDGVTLKKFNNHLTLKVVKYWA